MGPSKKRPGHGAVLSRRALLAGCAALPAAALPPALDRGSTLPSDWRRYADPTTEFEVYRLTDPSYSSRLPAHYARSLARRGNFLLFSSDRAGSPQAFRMDLKSGECRLLTEAAALDGGSLTLARDDRSAFFFDGSTLRQLQLSNLREREIYRVPDEFQRTSGFCLTDDGNHAVLGEVSSPSNSRLRRVTMAKGTAVTIVEAPFSLTQPIPRPRRAQVLYRQEDEALWLVDFDGRNNRRLKTPPGKIGPAIWSPSGRTILYLHYPEETSRLNAIRELTPDENVDKLVASTSQFVHFGSNSDSSVFVGASRNLASPYILLLLRITRRELTVCEHRASNPSQVAPIFSPDSQRIFFQSDHHGKSALYRIEVGKFVEATELDERSAL
ncbi:MAG: oligogalacturonate lyase family protein [Bryobacteraceae bacterium]